MVQLPFLFSCRSVKTIGDAPDPPISTNAMVASQCRGEYISTMIDWRDCQAVECDPQRVSGAWIFRGTRVPVRALFENLEDGATVDDFLEWFPGVQRAQTEEVLKHVESSLLTPT